MEAQAVTLPLIVQIQSPTHQISYLVPLPLEIFQNHLHRVFMTKLAATKFKQLQIRPRNAN